VRTRASGRVGRCNPASLGSFSVAFPLMRALLTAGVAGCAPPECAACGTPLDVGTCAGTSTVTTSRARSRTCSARCQVFSGCAFPCASCAACWGGGNAVATRFCAVACVLC
jgi:hypothetical protein